MRDGQRRQACLCLPCGCVSQGSVGLCFVLSLMGSLSDHCVTHLGLWNTQVTGTDHEQGSVTPCLWVAMVPAFQGRDLRVLVSAGCHSIESKKEQNLFLPCGKPMGVCPDGNPSPGQQNQADHGCSLVSQPNQLVNSRGNDRFPQYGGQQMGKASDI